MFMFLSSVTSTSSSYNFLPVLLVIPQELEATSFSSGFPSIL